MSQIIGELRTTTDAVWDRLSAQLQGMECYMERPDAPAEWTARQVLCHLLGEPGWRPVPVLSTFATTELPLIEINPGQTHVTPERQMMRLQPFTKALDRHRRDPQGGGSVGGVAVMDLFTCDVLVVGGGGAGLRAAIAVAETHPRLRVAVISKVYPMRSHTVSAEGGAAAVIKAEDSLDAHAYDTISGGDWLCDQDAVEAFVQEAPEEMLRLEHWGCPWNREPDGHIAVRPFGGMKIERTWFAADKTGFHLLHSLFQTTLKYDAIQRYDEFFVTKLLVDEGRCQGVVAIELSTGQIRAITAKAVILCTGGCGKVFPFTHRDPDHRGGAGGGRLAPEQGRLPVPPGLRPGHADAQAGVALHGVGPA